MGIKPNLEKPGLWVASYAKRCPKTGKVFSLRRTMYKSKAEALRAMPDLIVGVDRKMRTARLPTWAEFLPMFYESRRALEFTGKTIDNYRDCLEAHTLEGWGSKLVDEITTDEIRSLIRTGLAERSEGTKKNIVKMIRAVFRFAVEKGLIKENPTPKMSFKLGHKVKQGLTEEQARQFLSSAKACHHHWYPIWAAALYTGMRSGELYSLRWSSVDLDQRQIRVVESWNAKDGFKCTKNGDERIVSISPSLFSLLQELKHRSEGEFVLPRLRLWQRGEQAMALKMFLKGNGLPEIRFHDLRATWATILLSKGVTPAAVMTMGGWKEYKTLLVYLRKAGVDIKGATDCLSLEEDGTAGRVLKMPSQL